MVIQYRYYTPWITDSIVSRGNNKLHKPHNDESAAVLLLAAVVLVASHSIQLELASVAVPEYNVRG